MTRICVDGIEKEGSKVQVHPGEPMDSVPDHHSQASVPIKRVVIFFPVEGLAFDL